jgi:hypothetical protein
MLDMSFLQYIGSIGGIGAIFAVLFFIVYWITTKQSRQDRIFMEDRLTIVLKSYETSCDKTDKIISEHTKVLTELYMWLKAKNGD